MMIVCTNSVHLSVGTALPWLGNIAVFNLDSVICIYVFKNKNIIFTKTDNPIEEIQSLKKTTKLVFNSILACCFNLDHNKVTVKFKVK